MAEMHHTTVLASVELLDEAAMDAAALARACLRDTDWLQAHVIAGVFSPDGLGPLDATDLPLPTQWRFSCTTVVRARRVAQLEHLFDADPQLAALTVDLMEEVLELRGRLGPAKV